MLRYLCRVWGSGFSVQGLGLGFRVKGSFQAVYKGVWDSEYYSPGLLSGLL